MTVYYLHLLWVTCHDNNLPLVKQQMIITAVMAMANKIPTTIAAISPAVSLETETTSYTSAGEKKLNKNISKKHTTASA